MPLNLLNLHLKACAECSMQSGFCEAPSALPRLGWRTLFRFSLDWAPVGDHSEWSPAFVPLTSVSLFFSLALCLFDDQTIVTLSSTAEACQSDNARHSSLSCAWTARRCLAWLSRVLQEQACVSYLPLNLNLSLFSVVEDDEDDFPNTRTDGEFLHNNGSKEKCK